MVRCSHTLLKGEIACIHFSQQSFPAEQRSARKTVRWVRYWGRVLVNEVLLRQSQKEPARALEQRHVTASRLSMWTWLPSQGLSLEHVAHGPNYSAKDKAEVLSFWNHRFVNTYRGAAQRPFHRERDLDNNLEDLLTPSRYSCAKQVGSRPLD